MVAVAVMSASGGLPVPLPDAVVPELSPGPREQVVETLLLEVQLPSQAPEEPWRQESLGLAAVLLETFLADIPGVIAQVDGVPTTPGLALALSSEEVPWRVSLEVSHDDEGMQVVATVCDADDVCRRHLAVGPRGEPNRLLAEVTASIADQLGRELPFGIDVWAKPETSDDYTLLILGRAAATLYGFREPVPLSKRWDRRHDPVARAPFLDAKMPTAWIIYGRMAEDRRKWFDAYSYASQGREESVALKAARAASMELFGHVKQAEAVWAEIDRMAPGDLRYTLPRARAALSAGDPDRARAILAELGTRFDDDPYVVRLRVDIVDAEGVVSDEVLAAWQAADVANPEPVRRRIRMRIHDRRNEEALELTAELALRGQVEEASRYTLALANELGQWDAAADAAGVLELPDLARMLQAHNSQGEERLAVLEGAVGVEACLARANILLQLGRSEEALEALAIVLAEHAWMPEALELAARAHEASGHDEEARVARSRLAHADPLFGEARP